MSRYFCGRTHLLRENGLLSCMSWDIISSDIWGDEPQSRSQSTITQPEEYAAERFAVGVLMPACVLWGVGAFDAETIARLCNVSQEAAQRRSERLRLLRKREKFLTSPLERQVYKQFQSFIRKNK